MKGTKALAKKSEFGITPTQGLEISENSFFVDLDISGGTTPIRLDCWDFSGDVYII
jgi:hypothetical protein